MYELTNEQRKCFALPPVAPHWKRMELKPSPYDRHTTVAYLDGNVFRKVILSGSHIYNEYEICQQVSDDQRYLLPKTEKGKPVLLSAATLTKRSPIGMGFSYGAPNGGMAHIDICSYTSQNSYYSNQHEFSHICGEDSLQNWVEKWCRETTPEDLTDIARFAAQPRRHVKFREGDVFRFKINRRLYGYGRILLDYARMRKNKELFWDILAGKPLACSVYHIATERKDVTIQELAQLPSLPSVHMMDNRLFYGGYEIIGNIPVGEKEDYPIMYGGSISALYRAVLLQCGKLYRRDDEGVPLYRGFTNQGIGFGLGFQLSTLLSCIDSGTNEPYWAQDDWRVNRDLRNPKFRGELEQICKQFDLELSQLIPSP